LHDRPLDALSSPVNEPDLTKAAAIGLLKVLVDNRGNLFRSEGMEVDRVFDRKKNWIVSVGRRLGHRLQARAGKKMFLPVLKAQEILP